MTRIAKLSIILALAVFGFFIQQYFVSLKNQQDLEKFLSAIKPLNQKYHLVDVEILDQKDTLADLLKTDSFQVKPKTSENIQSLILKIKQNDSAKNLENLLLINLQTDQNLDEIVQDYNSIDQVDYAEPDYSIELNANDSIQTSNNSQSKNPATKSDVIVAVIDSGIDPTHNDLKNRLVAGINLLERNQKISDEVGHGTHVSGIILKNSPYTKVMPVKFTGTQNGKLSNLIKGIKFASDNGADVINLSLGLPQQSKSLKEAIDYAKKKNVVIVAAAGNNNSSEKYYPAAWTEVIAVAAIDKKGNKTPVSNYGDWIDFSALGQDVYSADKNGKYTYRTGTSQAAALVSAKLSEIIASDPDISFDQLYKKLQQNSKKPQGKMAWKLGSILN